MFWKNIQKSFRLWYHILNQTKGELMCLAMSVLENQSLKSENTTATNVITVGFAEALRGAME